MKLSAGDLGGILLVHKEAGMTSFDVVARIRRLCGLRKVGHMGTLDPFATGLLPVALGRSTGIIRYTDHYDKAYRVVIAVGQATDTEDLTGDPVPASGPPLTPALLTDWLADEAAFLKRKIAGLEGEQLQVPPMYSAVKIKGEPLYKYARRGETVDRPARPITVYQAQLIDIARVEGPAPLRLTVDFHVSKGTYIRTLASRLGEELGCGAHAAALTRTRCGPYKLEDSLKLADLDNCWSACSSRQALLWPEGPLLSPDTAVSQFPMLKLTLQEARALLQGKRLKLSWEKLLLPSDRGGSLSPPLESEVAGTPAQDAVRPYILSAGGPTLKLPGHRPDDAGSEGPSSLMERRFRAVSELGFVGIAKVKEISDHQLVIGAERMFANLDDYKF